MIREVQQYILARKNLSNRDINEIEIFIGVVPQRVIHFITFEDFYKKITSCVKKIKALIKTTKGKIVINGNLPQKYISKFMELAIKENSDFTIVVNDGYRLSKKNNFRKSN